MPVNVLTQRNDPGRQGINRQETQLHPGNVQFDSFGRLGSYPVDASVYAQPLFVSGVDCGAKGIRDLLIVATMGNSVFAFDTSKTDAGALIWHASRNEPTRLKLGPSVPSQLFQNGGYGDFYGKPIGILSTPVIDLNPASPGSGTIYLVSFQFDQEAFDASPQNPAPSIFQHILCAIDLGSGRILRQTTIQGQYPGVGYHSPRSEILPKGSGSMSLSHTLDLSADKSTSSMTIDFGKKNVQVIDATGLIGPSPTVHFNSAMQLQRPGLLLQGDNVFIAFGSRGDEDPYHGWLFSYRTSDFAKTGVFCTTPNGGRGGIWQAGQGLIQDSKGNIYAATGNGDNDSRGTGPILQGRNLGESFLGFRFDTTGLRLNGWFTFFDDFVQAPGPQTAKDARDDDFGAGAPALLPDDRIVGGGKDGWFFVIDPDQLDKNVPNSAISQAFKASFNFDRGSRRGLPPGDETHHIHGSPVVWNSGAASVFVYVWGENDVVRVYQYAPEANASPDTGLFIQVPKLPNFVLGQAPSQGIEFARGNIYASNEVANRHGMPGGFLSLSVNGNDAKSAILWAAFPPFGDANKGDVSGSLIAYDASNFDPNLAYKRLTMLWHSRQNPADGLGDFAKFCVPTVANGRVYQATGSDQVAIYGLRPNPNAIRLGFDGGSGGFVLNGSAIISPQGRVVLTEHAHNGSPTPYTDTTPTFLAGSIFTRETFDITRFNTSFTFLLTDAAADGFTFTIQAESPHAIGSPGSGVGYTVDPFALNAPAQQSAILHSFAVKFALGDPDGARTSHLALLMNGAQLPGFIDVDLKNQPVPVDLRAGVPITARLRYDGNILSVQMQVQGAPAPSPDFRLAPGDIAQQINAVQGKAFVGFTGGTGGRSARQEITNWSFKAGSFN
jgi:hypothetical protein